jgi:hypothetical protein
MFDQRAVASTPANIEVSAKDGRLELPVSFRLTDLGPGGTLVFSKGQVVYLDWE